MATNPYNQFALLQVTRGFSQYSAIRDASDINVQLSQGNALRLEFNALEKEREAQALVGKLISEGDRVVGTQRAAFANQGVDVSSGTARAVQQEAYLNTRLNVLDIQERARREALGFKIQARDVRLGSRLAEIGDRGRARSALGQGVSQGAAFYLAGQGA